MPNRITEAEECDATGDAMKNRSRANKKYLDYLLNNAYY